MKSDKSGCERWRNESIYRIMKCNFLWKTEPNHRYDFGLGNFAGIDHYPH